MWRVSSRAQVIDDLVEATCQEITAHLSDDSNSTGFEALVGPVEPLVGDGEGDENEELAAGAMAEEFGDMDEVVDSYLNVACLAVGEESQVEDDDDNYCGDLRAGVALSVLHKILKWRYLCFRSRELRDFGFCDNLLKDWKVNNPARFRRWLRINPDAFDALVLELSRYAGFHNNSHNKQTPVCIQLAIALYRMGSFGNRGGVEFTADLFGVSYGLVHLATNRVIMATMSSKELMNAVRWPTPEEQARCRGDVLEMCGGCEELSNGWCIMDGSLLRIYQRPHYCGSMFFDRKSRYSMNVQFTTIPSGEIIDYTCGHVGSSHDSFSMRSTRLYNDQKPEGPHHLLGTHEFCWGDSAYTLSPWLVKPYSDKETEGSKARRRFNRILARIRVRSEHTIGYLKGRFQSLHGLRIIISNETDMGFAMQWVRACIHLHMYCFKLEKIQCGPEEPFCRRGTRRLRKLKRKIRRAEARRALAIESEVHSRQSKGYSRRYARLNLELGKIRRNELCAAYKRYRLAQKT